MFLENAVINQLNYQLGDDAQLAIIGKAKNLIENSKNQGQ